MIHRSRLRRTLSALLLCLLLPGAAHADNSADEADAQFKLGAKAYQDGEYDVALAHFLASNRLAPNRHVAFNIARVYEQLGAFADAYRYYSAAARAERDPTARAPIDAALARVSPKVAVLDIQSSPPGATIYLERKDLGARGDAPETIGLPAGTYTVLLELEGHVPARLDGVELEVGKTRSVRVELAPILGTIEVQSTIAGLEVRVDAADGAPRRVGAGKLSARPGLRRLHLSAPGREPAELDVEVRADQTLVVRPQLPVRTGSLIVSSDVSNALVEVDGKAVGFAPAVVAVPLGAHVVRVSSPGFRPVAQDVVIAASGEQRIEAELLRRQEVSAVSRGAETVLEAPSSISIIDGRELRALGYPTIAEALRGTRGIYLSDDRSYTSIGIRGFSRLGDYGNKVLVLYDGLAANDNILGQSFPGFEGLTDLHDVERIEVVRGPSSSLYGTGAFFGVVNVVRHGEGQPTRAEATVSSGGGATRGRLLAYLGGGEGSAVWMSGSFAGAAGNDYYFPEFASDPSGGNARGVDGFTAGTAQLRAIHGPFSAQAVYTQRRKTLPTGEYETIFGDPRHVWTDRRGMVELKAEPRVSDRVESLTRAHGNLYHFAANSPYEVADGGVAREDYLGAWIGVEQRFRIRPTDGLRLTVGGEVQRHLAARLRGEDDSGPYLPDDENPYWVVSGYAEGELRLGSAATLTAGARGDVNIWQFAEPLGETSRGSVNPRVAGVFRPYEAGVIKVIAGKAFRAPSVYELFYQGAIQRPSPDLAPEEVYSGELEYTHLFSSVLSSTVAVYANYLTDLVVGRGDGTEESPLYLVNSDAPVLALGVEGETRRNWKDGWMLAATLGVQRTAYVANTAALREVSNSPTVLGSIKGVAPVVGDALRLGSRLSFESGRYDRRESEDEAPQERSDPSAILDVTLSGDVFGGALGYVFGVYNLADQRAGVPVSAEFTQVTIPHDGRTFAASITGKIE